MAKQEPMLMESPLTKRVYVVTSYIDHGNGTFTARRKYDVTEQFDMLARVNDLTCEVECFDDGIDEGMDGEWFSYSPPTWYLSCGHEAYGSERPKFCPVCGARIVEVDDER